jgi:hypothetical protein
MSNELIREKIRYMQTQEGQQYLMNQVRIHLQEYNPSLFTKLLSQSSNDLQVYLKRAIGWIVYNIKRKLKDGGSFNNIQVEVIRECVIVL